MFTAALCTINMDAKGEGGLGWIGGLGLTYEHHWYYWEPAVSHRELYSMLCGELNGEEI